jgi:hypothetical protein
MQMKIMRAEIGDRTMDLFDRIIESHWCDRACWIVIVTAALYFGVHAYIAIYIKG